VALRLWWFRVIDQMAAFSFRGLFGNYQMGLNEQQGGLFLGGTPVQKHFPAGISNEPGSYQIGDNCPSNRNCWKNQWRN